MITSGTVRPSYFLGPFNESQTEKVVLMVEKQIFKMIPFL